MPRQRTGYFIVLNDMIDHPKCVGLSPYAWTLWIHGMSHCSRNLTDGHIPAGVLPRLAVLKDPAKAAAELVDAGLWDRTTEGWVIHDYLHVQRSRDQVEADRSNAAERQARHRKNKQTSDPPGVTPPVTRDTAVTEPLLDPPSTTTSTKPPPPPPAHRAAAAIAIISKTERDEAVTIGNAEGGSPIRRPEALLATITKRNTRLRLDEATELAETHPDWDTDDLARHLDTRRQIPGITPPPHHNRVRETEQMLEDMRNYEAHAVPPPIDALRRAIQPQELSA